MKAENHVHLAHVNKMKREHESHSSSRSRSRQVTVTVTRTQQRRSLGKQHKQRLTLQQTQQEERAGKAEGCANVKGGDEIERDERETLDRKAKKSERRKKRRKQKRRIKAKSKAMKQQEKVLRTTEIKRAVSYYTQDSLLDNSLIFNFDDLPEEKEEQKQQVDQIHPIFNSKTVVVRQHEELIELTAQCASWLLPLGDCRHEKHELFEYYCNNNNNMHYQKQQQRELQFFQNCWRELNSSSVHATFKFRRQHHFEVQWCHQQE